MLKIYINNEEVIANQNFTIQKHMLNTPSVILNNVCPKTWCDEKDYITNFYHPLDYSKCKIVDETFHPTDPGETITGTSFTIQDYDSTKLVELTELEGNTTQSGTPTPDSPQPINVVSGRQEVSVIGKNLFNSAIQKGTYNTTVYTIDTDGKINQSATDSSNWNANQKRNFKLSAGTYTLRIFGKTSNQNLQIRNITDSTDIITTKNDIVTFTLNSEKTIALKTWGSSGYPVSYYIELEKGEITDPTYEQYKGQNYEINLGKNIYYMNYTDFTHTWNGVTINSTHTGYSITGTATSNGGYTLTSRYITLPSGTYTMSLKNVSTMITGLSKTNYSSVVRIPIGSKSETFTLTEETKVCLTLQIVNGTEYNEENEVMICKGTNVGDFSPYKTPIELCKIGTYQDRIYKENGTWYLHKEIGKVVLDGSENWQYTNNVLFVINNDSIQSNGILIKSNYLSGANSQGNTSGVNTNPDNSICLSNSGQNRIYIKASQFTSADNFKTWLSTHNTTLYYVLATPTTTEITDSELISQLNSIELLEGLNNVSVSSEDLPGIITIHYNYKEAYTTEDLLFCGVVKNSGKISLNPREPHYTTLQVLDFKDFLSSGETLDFVIYQKTILEAIQQVISTVQDYGFILGNVNILNPNEIIGAYSTKDKTAYDVFNYIADITQSRWTTRMIDENTVAIDFYDPTLMPQGTEIDYTNAYFNDKLIDDMKYSYGTNNYRNKQVMISKQVYSNISQAQTIVANGYQTQFPTEQPIGKINSITSNGIPLTFATFNEKDMGYVADFYYNPGDNYFESDDLRSTGEVLIIDYVAIVEGRQVITNSTEIDRINESTGRKGIIARYETRNDATTSTELQKIGESYIKYKGTPEIVLTIQSRKNTWEVGERVQFNAPIDELDTEYMVRSKKINYIANQQENESQLFYTYELISSFNSETEINYFDNQRAKASGNIGEGEYISRNIDIESLAEIIFYDTETTEVQVSGDNELNAILNSPFIS